MIRLRMSGKACFFSLAALGAEGISKAAEMIIGNGCTKNHADITPDVLRGSERLRKLFAEKYV